MSINYTPIPVYVMKHPDLTNDEKGMYVEIMETMYEHDGAISSKIVETEILKKCREYKKRMTMKELDKLMEKFQRLNLIEIHTLDDDLYFKHDTIINNPIRKEG